MTRERARAGEGRRGQNGRRTLPRSPPASPTPPPRLRPAKRPARRSSSRRMRPQPPGSPRRRPAKRWPRPSEQAAAAKQNLEGGQPAEAQAAQKNVDQALGQGSREDRPGDARPGQEGSRGTARGSAASRSIDRASSAGRSGRCCRLAQAQKSAQQGAQAASQPTQCRAGPAAGAEEHGAGRGQPRRPRAATAPRPRPGRSSSPS